ncbi:MAG: Txe/YoeB family addiction module toxin [Bacteroidales bacterium]|jgi:toxin YoeB|nr:Txe/YoeB family addiction module toxin [Bacteroidales bacterium]
MEVNFIYSPDAVEDIEYWKISGQKKIIKKIDNLLKDIALHPQTGIGKPEQLRHQLSGYWARRIDNTHRLIYQIMSDEEIQILSLRDHYDKKLSNLE